MIRRTRSFIAVSLLLAAPAAWAFSPYYPQPHYVYAPAATPGYMYPRSAPLSYPPFGYRPAPIRHPRTTEPGKTPRQDRPIQPAVAAPSRDTRPAPAKQDIETAVEPGSGDHRTEFLERLRPLVERENARLLALREELSDLLGAHQQGTTLSKAQRKKVRDLADRYRIEADPLDSPQAARELLDKVDVVPVSLALAQAANESAWGKSRFAKEGNNLFGIWTYDESQGIVPRNRAPGKKHLVRRFDSIADSVRYYMFTLNSHPAYTELRAIRAERRRGGQPLDGHSLADGLTRYSAKGEEYVRLIQAMIRRFDLATFDATLDREA